MKIFGLVIAACLLPSLAFAAQLTYKIDLVHSNMDETTAFDLCGLPKTIQLDSREDLATVVIQKTQATNPNLLKLHFIQATEGAIVGGDLVEPYMGDRRTRVALVNVKIEGYGDVYTRIEVVTFGSKQAPKAFTVDVDLLNYRESAELAEGSLCTGFGYRLL